MKTEFIPWKDISFIEVPNKKDVLFYIVEKDTIKHPFKVPIDTTFCWVTKNTKKELYTVLKKYTITVYDDVDIKDKQKNKMKQKL